MVVAAVVGAGALTAGATMMASGDAVDAAQAGAQLNASTQRDFYNATNARLAPWVTAGTDAQNKLTALTGTGDGMDPLSAPLTRRFDPTIAQLEQTPGYQFIKDQGLKATQNSFAAKGLATSGAAMKGAADYSAGLAESTYQQQFSNYWAETQNIFNDLFSQSSLGESAGAQVGAAGTSAGNSIGSGFLQAAGVQGAASMANANAIGGTANNLTSYLMFNQLMNRTAPGAAPPGGGAATP